MMMRALVLLLALAFGFAAAAESVLSGTIVGTHDGDTATLLDGSKREIKIRLHQIDSPELSQDFGNRSKQALASLIFGRLVDVEVIGTDKYGRTLGRIRVGSTDVNLEMVRQGMAWVYRKYATEPAYFAAEEDARQAMRGLWSRPDAMPPWEFRHPEQRGVGAPLGLMAPAVPQGAAPSSPRPAGCGSKRFCKEMTTCDEARFYLRTCGIAALDKDGDGTPCESLCR